MVNKNLIVMIHAYLYSIALYLTDNCGIRDRKVDEKGHYYDLAVEVGWGTFYLNAIWLLYNYDDKRILFWQIEMTVRLLYETVVDTDYALTKSDIKHLRSFFSYLDKDFSNRKVLEDYKKAMEDMNLHRKNSLGSTTMNRINDYFKTRGIVTYNILSQFQHLNVAGFCSACEESRETTPFRATVPVTIYYLSKEMKKTISLAEKFTGIDSVAEELEKILDEKIEEICEDE